MVSATLKVTHILYLLECTEENEIWLNVALDFHIKIVFNMISEKQRTVVIQGMDMNWDMGKRHERNLLYF